MPQRRGSCHASVVVGPMLALVATPPEIVCHVLQKLDSGKHRHGDQREQKTRQVVASTDHGAQRRKNPDHCCRRHSPDQIFSRQNPPSTYEADAGDHLTYHPGRISRLSPLESTQAHEDRGPRQISMLVRIPAGLPWICRSSPTIAPHKAATPTAIQKSTCSGSKGPSSSVVPPRRVRPAPTFRATGAAQSASTVRVQA